jgi:hypothetical protein
MQPQEEDFMEVFLLAPITALRVDCPKISEATGRSLEPRLWNSNQIRSSLQRTPSHILNTFILFKKLPIFHFEVTSYLRYHDNVHLLINFASIRLRAARRLHSAPRRSRRWYRIFHAPRPDAEDISRVKAAAAASAAMGTSSSDPFSK